MNLLERPAVILGGGPAGLATGIALAQSGVPAVLFERRALPHAKVCGEGLMPTGLAALRELGVRLPESAAVFRGIRYVDAGTGSAAVAEFQEGPGRGLPRRILADRLLEAARAHADLLEIRDRTLCDAITPLANTGEWELRVGDEFQRTPLLIGADGLHSAVRRAATLERAPGKRSPLRWGARWHFELAPWTDELVEVRLAGSVPGVECYVTPVGPREVGVAFLWNRRQWSPDGGARGLLPGLLDCFPEVRERLDGLGPLDDGGAIGPLYQPVRAVTAPGVMLLGDAAGYIDAATGEGLSLAFEQAVALRDSLTRANTADDAPISPRTARRVLRRYRRDYKRITANYRLTTRLVLWLGRRPRLLRRVIAGLRASPRFFQHLLSVNMNTSGFFAVSPIALVRFLTGALRGPR
mgnify:CR=1 FL=1